MRGRAKGVGELTNTIAVLSGPRCPLRLQFTACGRVSISPMVNEAELNGECELNEEDLERIRQLVRADGLYRVKLEVGNGRPPLLAAVRACDLVRNGFRDELSLLVDDTEGVLGLDYRAPVGPLSATKNCRSMARALRAPVRVTTAVKIVRAADAQVIPVQVQGSPPPGMEGIRAPGMEEADAKPTQKSFFARYWYIILPVMVMMMTSGQDPKAGGEGGGGGGGGGGGR